MSQRVYQWLVICAIVLSVGGHWFVLQSLAWSGMILSYSRNSSFIEALQKTFDGRHPCKLCHAVKSGRAAEHQQPRSKIDTQLDLLLPVAWTLVPRVWHGPPIAFEINPFPLPTDKPPVPPPRRQGFLL